MSTPLFLAPMAGLALPRRSFLQYSGASAAAASLWLAGCAKKEEDTPTPAGPTIASFAPGSGAPGAGVTLTGTNFTGATAVAVGGVAATFTVVNASTITLMVPVGSQTGAIVVTTAAGTATSSSAFTVLPLAVLPVIAGFTPSSAAPGTTVTLTGTNFTGATAVTVGGMAVVFAVVSATSLTFVVPVGAQTGVVAVTVPAGTVTSSIPFTVLAAMINVGTGDVGVLNYAYALEQLEAAFYTQVRSGSYYQGLASGSAERLIFDDLYYHEVIHREFFKAALGTNAIPDLTPNFSSIDFSTRASVLGAAKAFEDLGVAAYNGVVRFVQSAAYLVLAGKIVSVEARHAALIRDLIQEGSFVAADVASVGSSSLEMSQPPTNVAAIVNTFLASGSKLNVSGLV